MDRAEPLGMAFGLCAFGARPVPFWQVDVRGMFRPVCGPLGMSPVVHHVTSCGSARVCVVSKWTSHPGMVIGL